MGIQAKYLGQDNSGSYRVNVRTANPTGKLGDAGVIRYFDTKEEAKDYAKIVNTTGVDVYQKTSMVNDDEPVRHAGDTFGKEAMELDKNLECPKISWARAAFSRLTNEQITIINETRKLPQGTKFVPNGYGGYTLSNNYGGIVTGTRTMPEGFELKKNWLGFTVVVPKETESIFIK